MPVELTIVETVTELETTVTEIILESSSTPGPAGPGVPEGGTDGQVLTKTSATDYDTAWEDPTGGGGGAPDDATYLVTTAHDDLSDEVVVGATPGGELGGTWASPTVDATHSGSSHAGVQAAAEATAAGALAAHEADTTSVHGIANTAALALTANAVMDGDTAGGVLGGTYPNPSFAADMATQAELDAHASDTTSVHGIADTTVLATDSEVASAVSDHNADTTSVHGIADTSALALTANVQPLDSDLTAIAALTTDAAGRSVLVLTDPNADRIGFWDDSAGAFTWLTAGSGLTITDTTLTATGGSGADPDDEDLILHMRSFA